MTKIWYNIFAVNLIWGNVVRLSVDKPCPEKHIFNVYSLVLRIDCWYTLIPIDVMLLNPGKRFTLSVTLTLFKVYWIHYSTCTIKFLVSKGVSLTCTVDEALFFCQQVWRVLTGRGEYQTVWVTEGEFPPYYISGRSLGFLILKIGAINIANKTSDRMFSSPNF